METLRIEMENKIIENNEKTINCQRKQYEIEREEIFQVFEVIFIFV